MGHETALFTWDVVGSGDEFLEVDDYKIRVINISDPKKSYQDFFASKSIN